MEASSCEYGVVASDDRFNRRIDNTAGTSYLIREALAETMEPGK
jgi:hypothetical protein